jgi:D-glycero-alpha-D-manno-heptose-7-phosphate kinase
MGIERGVEIHHDGDLPARSGMGSSSSFTVGLLHALYALKGQIRSKRQLATESIYLEQERLKETVGSQDQVMAAYGGFNHVTFAQDGDISVEPITLSSQRIHELNDHLMLFYTGIMRNASDVAGSYVPDIGNRSDHFQPLVEMVDEGISILGGRQGISSFGELLHRAWQAKVDMSPNVSNAEVDDIYRRARDAGAIGGKLLGAGGGGFMLLFVPPAQQAQVKDQLQRLIHVPFGFEHSGSQIIFLDNEQDYSFEEAVRSNQNIQSFRELNLAPGAGED